MIRITAKRDGFRRCGIAHPAAATDYPDKAFSEKHLEILKNEPMLVVEIGIAPTQPGTPAPTRFNVTDTVKLVEAAATLEELDKFKGNEDRKGVLDAIAKKEKELTPAE